MTRRYTTVTDGADAKGRATASVVDKTGRRVVTGLPATDAEKLARDWSKGARR